MLVRSSGTKKSGFWISYADFKVLINKGSDRKISEMAIRREAGGIDKWSETQRRNVNKEVNE